MLKGDAAWLTRKTVLGWIIDTLSMTITLAPHRLERLHEILEGIRPNQKRVSVQTWHKVMGELRSMAVAIPGARGLFSSLQEAFRRVDATKKRLRLTAMAHDFLDDFRWLAKDLGKRPTRIAEVIPSEPVTRGACDASSEGMGGVHFVPLLNGSVQPIVWRATFPKKVRDNLSTYDNHRGAITNSDLELAGSIAQADVLAQFADVRELTTHNCYDNTAAVCWQRKGSTTTMGPAAHLLRQQALHQRHHRYVPLHDYIPGPINGMADLALRSKSMTDSQFLLRINSEYPQTVPWKLCPLRKPTYSGLISCLFKKRLDPESLLNVPMHSTTIGNAGIFSASSLESILSSVESTTRSHTCKSLPKDIGTAELRHASSASDLEQWRTRYGLWVRSSPAWGPRTLGKIPPAPLTFEHNDN